MALQNQETVEISYDDGIVKAFSLATLLWGFVAMLVGVVVAFQLAVPALSLDLPWLTFGRLRPLHTNAAIFAFVGNGIFAGVYYSLQRLLKVRMFSDTSELDQFLGLADHHCCGGDHPAHGVHQRQGVRRIGVAH